MNVSRIADKAKSSGVYLRMINIVINRIVPFNKPHHFKILEISDNHLKTLVPYRKSNFNHIKGIHACALATLSEFTTGFLLLTKLDSKKYRLIMHSLSMDYHYQAKMDAYATFFISKEWLEELIYKPLDTGEKVLVDCTVEIYDKESNHISSGLVKWQIKSWEQVKTKV